MCSVMPLHAFAALQELDYKSRLIFFLFCFVWLYFDLLRGVNRLCECYNKAERLESCREISYVCIDYQIRNRKKEVQYVM